MKLCAHLPLVGAGLALGLAACSPAASTQTPQPEQGPQPPVARIEAHELEAHGEVRVDNYYWLRERDNPEVIAYLEAENAYTEAMTADTAELRKEIEAELAGRIKQDDTTVPFRERDYFYYQRWAEGGDYPVIYRKRGSLEADDELVLDLPKLAEGQTFFQLGSWDFSENQQILAYTTDTTGRRIYTVSFVDLSTGERLSDEIAGAARSLAWAQDDRHLFYLRQDPVTLRNHQVFRHTLGSDPSGDTLVYEEGDETFGVSLRRSKSREYLFVGSYSTLSSEMRYLPTAQPEAELRVFEPRAAKHEYYIDHLGDHFYVRSNLDAKNFRVMRTPVAATERANWEEIVPHREDVLLWNIELFRDHLVLAERCKGLVEYTVRRLSDGSAHRIDFGEPAYSAAKHSNLEIDSNQMRFTYQSLSTPRTVFDYDLDARTKQQRKQVEVLGGFSSDNYVSERLEATARDGTKVPISLVYRRAEGAEPDAALGEARPLLLYGYGSYGVTLDARFSSDRLSLLDRGFAFAIAHIRGGADLGFAWYEDGKLLNKRNTFTDFIDCAEFLISAGYADPKRLFAAGGSAGGLLMGAVVNMRPELFAGVLAAVPFVDVVTTMLDTSIPLTTGEFDEWGDPRKREYYDYMLSYSPYDNVTAQAYPAMLVTTGLHDSQVQYWEPAKWVAKLRATKTDSNPLLLRTNMDAGHGGASGRLSALEEQAFAWAFLLKLAGLAGVEAAR